MPLVLSCIMLDVTLTTSHFYPDARYTTGLLFFLPMAIGAGLAILGSLVIFPESVGRSFRTKLGGVVKPLAGALASIEELFEHASTAARAADAEEEFEEWADRSVMIRKALLSSLAGIPPLQAKQRYLYVDFSYTCLNGHDLRDVFDLVATVQARSSGLAFFFDVLIMNAKHSHLDSSAYSVHQASRPPSRPASRPASVRNSPRDRSDETSGNEAQINSPDHDPTADRSYFVRAFNKRRLSPGPGHRSHRGSHLSLFEYMSKAQQPVGLYETQQYMELERAFQE